MTAPLLQKINTKKTNAIQVITLRTSTYQLIDAIDNNNIEQVEQCMSEILRNNVPEISIRMFLNYAELNKKAKVCEYLGLVLLATYNTAS